MTISEQIAKHFKDLYFGGNWTWSNLKDHLSDVTWQEATTKVHDLNTIAILANHIHYYVHAVLQVLEGKPLDAKDKYSFDHPPIQSQDDWEAILSNMWTEAETFAKRISELPESTLHEIFDEEKYGTYYRNLNGIIEHSHYHLGQIVIIKKLLRASDNK